MTKTKKDRKVYEKMTNYPVGDFLIRIKNAGFAGNREVKMQKTRLVKNMAEALKREGYLLEVGEKEDELIVKLAYRRKEPVLMDLKLISKPGLRVYMGVDQLEKIKSPAVLILTTPQGVMSARDAIKKRIGGEVLVEIW